jgi:hypothetical protein
MRPKNPIFLQNFQVAVQRPIWVENFSYLSNLSNFLKSWQTANNKHLFMYLNDLLKLLELPGVSYQLFNYYEPATVAGIKTFPFPLFLQLCSCSY